MTTYWWGPCPGIYIPALIVLPFCDGGELLIHVTRAGRDGLTTTKRLSYAAQIALGMQYLSLRNIVHRDLAARNILLDTMLACKVADFGMSASLVQTCRTYAAKYARVHEEIALRWASNSPEAMQHEKFSTASDVKSDVWAYGVTIWEIFNCGLSEPYGNLGNSEIGPYVKGGGKLAAPHGDVCPSQVYTEVMLPCWAMGASNRPSFGEFEMPIAPSVHYFRATLLPELHAAVAPTVEANLAGQGDCTATRTSSSRSSTSMGPARTT